MNPRNFYNQTAGLYEERHKSPWFHLVRKKETEIIERFKKGKTLDLGCGTGYHMKHADVGVDISEEMLKGIDNNVRVMDGEKLDFPDNSFDTVLCILSVLNLCEDHKKMVSEIRRVLKPNGRIILSVSSIYDQPKPTKEDVQIKNIITNKLKCKINLFSKKYMEELFQMKLIHFDSI